MTRRIVVSAVLALMVATTTRHASAKPEFWTDGDGAGLWNDDGDWQTYDAANRLPQTDDVVYFNRQTPDMIIRLSGINTNPLHSIYFSGDSNGYTIGFSPTDGNVVMEDGGAIAQQANVIGNNEGTTFGSPVELQGFEAIANFSPNTPVTTVPGIAGYNNPLTLSGGLIKDNGSETDFLGAGDIVISGPYVATSGGNIKVDMAAGSLVLSGTNNVTNSNVIVGGGLVLDYTTNNTPKFSTTNSFQVGNGFTNYNGNVPANGGHVVIDANESAPTTLTVGGTTFSGSSSIVVNGSSDQTVATTVNFGYINTNGTYAGSTDITTHGNVSLYTNSTNAFQYGEQTRIINQQVTIDKSYFAQAGGNTYAYQGSGGYGYNSTPVLITPLVNDDGIAFNTKYGEFHVAAEASDVQTVTPDSNNTSGADTVRFTSSNDPLGGVDSAHTLDLAGTNFYMDYGAIMLTQAFTGDATVQNGTIHPGVNGLSLVNFSAGMLTVSANITSTFAVNAGTVKLSGNNLVGTNDQIVYVNDGKLILGSSTALGTGNQLDMGSATAVLDLNGNNTSVTRLLSDQNYVPGNAAAAAGLNSNIENTKTGSLSVLQIAGIPAGNVDGPGVSTTNVYSFNNLGEYYGGLNEVSGSIISLDIEQGTAANPVEFVLGTANPYGDATGSNTNSLTGVQGSATNITGAVVVGAGANLGLTGYGNIETLGVTNLNGLLGPRAQQLANYGTTYLTGNGQLGGQYNGWGFGLTTVGSIANTFNGSFGTAGVSTGFGLQVGGTSTVALANAYYGSNLAVSQDATLTMSTIADGASATINSHGTLVITSPTAAMNSNFYLNGGGTLEIAPSGAGQAVTVTNNSGYIGNNNNGSVVLNPGQNTSLTYEIGNQDSQAHFEFFYDNSFTLGVTQGLAALGNTTKFLVQSSQAIMGESYQMNLPNNILGTSFYAQDDSAGSPKNATFIQISNTANANVYSLTPYAYDSAHTNNLNSATVNDIELITAGTTYTYTGNSFGVLGLQLDKGAVLQNNGSLVLGDYIDGTSNPNGTNSSGVILNGGKIMGNNVGLYRATSFYADADGGEIQNLNVGGQDITKNGTGALVIDNYSNLGYTTIEQGALDLINLSNNAGLININGGVLQTGQSITRQLGNQLGQLELTTGGFAARQATPGGSITITLNNASGRPNLVWGVGGTPYFLSEEGTLDFGSSTANSKIYFASNINLGVPEGGSAGQQALYTRVINVTGSAADAGVDPLSVNDSVEIDGNISASDPYVGLAKSGTGTLDLNGNNTYTGATIISQGTLSFVSDSNLGAAPAAAYALNTTPGVHGAALTPGAIQISGGAELALLAGDTTLNSNRQLLLASGATGASPALLDVNKYYGSYSTLRFGGAIADYVGEVGSLQKIGGGTFNYSGTAANTGTYLVTEGTMIVSGAGSVNSASGITVNNTSVDPNATAQFNYASTVGLTKTVSYGAGGGIFAYNSGVAYSGANAMTIGGRQVIAGAGNMSGTVMTIGAGGTLLPGNINTPPGTASVGTLTTGAMTLLNGGNYNFLIQNVAGAGGPNYSAAAGVGYSTVMAGMLDLSALTNPFSLNLETLGADGTAGSPANFNHSGDYDFVLFSTAPGAITPQTEAQLAQEFVIDAGANNGATGFAGANSNQFYVYENANDSQLILHYSAVPEPATWAMFFGGLGLLAFVRRLRHRSA